MLSIIGNAIRVLLFFLGLWKEKNDTKAKKKAVIGKEIVDAFTETDPKTRASRLNTVVGRIKRL